MSTVKLMVALDVGSTHSGYAYAFTSNPSDIRTSVFKQGGEEFTKVPTSILLNKDRKCAAFGHEAEEKYIQNFNHGDKSCILFRQFKMGIQHNPCLGRNTKIKDVSGRHNFSALSIMTMAIRFLKNHMIRSLNVAMEMYCEDDCHFVIMVPGIWTDRAKALVRTAALAADVMPNRLNLVLESEAASLWQQSQLKDSQISAKGTKYVTVDLGGGTADIIVHESRGDGTVTSLHVPYGGLWGGSSVEDCFMSYLHLIFGLDVVTQFRTNFTSDFVQMMRDFEKNKISHQALDAKSRFSVNLPQSLLTLAGELKDLVDGQQLCTHVSSSCFGGNFELKQTTLFISEEQTQGMFDYTSKSLSSEISSLLTESASMKSIRHIVICGGFAASKIVQNHITNSLNAYSIVTSNGLGVDFPADGGLIPLKGAVLCGLYPNRVHTRVVRLTYGIKATVPYDESQHKGGETKTINGTLMCTNAFQLLLPGKTEVKVGHQVVETTRPLTADDTAQTFEIFSTGIIDDVPAMTSHHTMNKEFEFYVPVPVGRNLDDKYFDRSVTFGGTELQFKVAFKKGKTEPYTKYISV